ncbi:hypothetical protein FXW07_15935 [Methanosarcina sp. DH1]|uniref:hypothetical protein n=1 Tax=Methanosarcina sp. DH1 TaxID=2605695 RepID=UPI001E641F9E|nr:hypothetical protein [Methanosarcina sp. DH1]MCC4768046.1 hypothetical protein [Methanosarcina sp. DH1]
MTAAQETLDNLVDKPQGNNNMMQISHWSLLSEVRPRIRCRRRSSVSLSGNVCS